MNFKKKSKFLVSIFFCILVISFLAPFSFADNLVAPAQICQIFPDKGFAEAITRHLGKKSMYEFVTQKELNKIKIFVQMGTKEISTKISNINGIQYLNKLEHLLVNGGQISNLNPLSTLRNLYEIQFSFNQISDLRPLTNLTSLYRMDLSENLINDLTPLSKLINLYWLELRNNQINDLSPLKKLKKLEILNVSTNQICSIKHLLDLKRLTNLYLENNPIIDLNILLKNGMSFDDINGGIIRDNSKKNKKMLWIFIH